MTFFRKLITTFSLLGLLGACSPVEETPKPTLEVDTSPIVVEENHEVAREFVAGEGLEPIFTIEDISIASVMVGEGIFTVSGISIGETSLVITSSEGDPLATIAISVIEPVIYLPIPMGALYIKGIGKTASVRGVITDSSVIGEAIWSVSDSEIVSFEAQGLLAVFTTLKRGNTTVTLTYGHHDASFVLYVTNLKGE